MVSKTKFRILIVVLIICSAFCKEEQNLNAKDNTQNKVSVTDRDPEWDPITGVYAMNDGRVLFPKFKINSQLVDYCLQLDLKENTVSLGLVEGKILKGKIISLEKGVSFQYELNGVEAKYYFVSGIFGGTGEEVQVLTSDEFTKRTSNGNWEINSSAGSQAAFNTMKGCVNQLKLAIELQYREKN